MKKIIIDEELCTKIEILQYEVNSRKEIITSLLQTNDNISTAAFKAYQDAYKDYYTQYNKAKQELIKQYEVPAGASWNLKFETRELTY